MKRIRIGKDISMRWEITTDGAAIPLEGRDLTIEMKSPIGIVSNIPFRVDGNTLIMTYYGTEQKRTGEYSITLWEKKGKPGQNVVDVIRAFELVRTSQEEYDFVGGDLQIESVDLGTENFDILTEGGYRAINIDTIQAEALEDSVNINGKTYSNESFTITLPKANLDSAGVIGASDVRTLKEHADSIAQIKTSCEKNASDISVISDEVDALKSQADTNTSNISSLNTEVHTLQSKVDENTTSISQINTELDNKNNEITQINNTLAEHTERINANITTDRIENGAVTTEKIATSAFDSTLSVSGKIAPADVVGEKITELSSQAKKLISEITSIKGSETTFTAEGTPSYLKNNTIFPSVNIGEEAKSISSGKNHAFIIPIQKGAKVSAYVRNNTEYPCFVVDESYIVLEKFNSDSGRIFDRSINIDRASYLIVNVLPFGDATLSASYINISYEGIAKAVKEDVFDKIGIYDVKIIEGAYSTGSGIYSNEYTNYVCTNKIKVSNIKKLSVKGAEVRTVVYWDSNYNFLGSTDYANMDLTNACYIAFNFLKELNPAGFESVFIYSKLFSEFDNKIKRNEENLDDLRTKVYINIYDGLVFDIIKNKYIAKQSGEITDNSQNLYQITSKISVKEGDVFHINAKTYNTNIYSIYREDGTFIKGSVGITYTSDKLQTMFDGTIEITQELISLGASYLIVCGLIKETFVVKSVVSKPISEEVNVLRNKVESIQNSSVDLIGKNIFLLGDSISSTDYTWYKDYLEKYTGASVMNKGASGWKTWSIASNAYFQRFGSTIPDYIVIMVGGNDDGAVGSIGTFDQNSELAKLGESVENESNIEIDFTNSGIAEPNYSNGTHQSDKYIVAVSHIVRKAKSMFYNYREKANINATIYNSSGDVVFEGTELECRSYAKQNNITIAATGTSGYYMKVSDSKETVNQKLMSVPHTKIILCSPIKQQRYNTSHPFSLKDNWNRKRLAVIECCEKYDVPFIDLMKEFCIDMSQEPFYPGSGLNATDKNIQQGVYTMDGLHPNEAGYEWIAKIVASFLKGRV